MTYHHNQLSKFSNNRMTTHWNDISILEGVGYQRPPPLPIMGSRFINGPSKSSGKINIAAQWAKGD
ncbi:MAG: hypothetical protein WAM14_13750 [Candidatus Nitrosopolaris sp.]